MGPEPQQMSPFHGKDVPFSRNTGNAPDIVADQFAPVSARRDLSWI